MKGPLGSPGGSFLPIKNLTSWPLYTIIVKSS